MPNPKPRTARLSQTISPFGVGAILDVEGESLMAADISRWPERHTRRITSRRVEMALGVAELRSPPSVPSIPAAATPGLEYRRFPAWLFCQNCRRMHHMRMTDENGRPPRCQHCSGPMVPMRFIAVGARHGHATDIPWNRWAHSEAEDEDQRRCQSRDLLFRSTAAATEGLASLEVRCTVCQAHRHLGELTHRGALQRIGFRCTGAQPWQSPRQDGCEEPLEVLQRGANNVTLSDTTTALDIPEPSLPVSNIDADIRRHRNFEDIRTGPTGPLAEALIGLIAKEHDVEPAYVLRLVHADAQEDDALSQAREGLLADEWLAFRQAIDHPDEPVGTEHFIVSRTSLLPPTATHPTDGSIRTAESALRRLETLLGPVVLAHRLREIRVLHGFRRFDATADLVDVDLGPRGRTRWLPAVEAFGEGLMLTLDETRLSVWEADPTVSERVATLERRRQSSGVGARQAEITPRLVLLHTLGHLLMRQLAYSCGYSQASLRERVYATRRPGVPEAGVLIYTAAGDAEGTLGGLVRQGEPPRLVRTLLAALESAAWCSADPLCRESRGQGPDSLNLAACHGCSLVSETSCERGNLALDRTLLFGSSTVPGYFAEIIDDIRREAAEQDAG